MEQSNISVLVTGGAGFIGSHLVEELVKRGYRVRVLDNLMRSSLSNIKPLIDTGKVEFINGDIRHENVVSEVMKGIDYVFHEAAVCINRSVVYPKESLDINLNGSCNIFNSALENKVKKVIFASSASVYGNPQKLPMSENDSLNPITPYCIAKLASEFLLKYFSEKGLNYAILRYFNVYGPRQNIDAYYTSVIITFVKRLLNNQSPVIIGNGKQSMDFINVKDVVKANILAMSSNITNETFNVGSGNSTSIADLANILIKILNIDVKPEFIKKDVIVKERRADISKIKSILNFTPKVGLEEGLIELVEDIKSYPEKY